MVPVQYQAISYMDFICTKQDSRAYEAWQLYHNGDVSMKNMVLKSKPAMQVPILTCWFLGFLLLISIFKYVEMFAILVHFGKIKKGLLQSKAMNDQCLNYRRLLVRSP